MDTRCNTTFARVKRARPNFCVTSSVLKGLLFFIKDRFVIIVDEVLLLTVNICLLYRTNIHYFGLSLDKIIILFCPASSSSSLSNIY